VNRETEGLPVTDPELVHRAEQAYLGALVARQGRAGTSSALFGDAGSAGLGLRPQDFADPVHQAVYAALASQALPGQGGLAGLYERLRAQLTRLLSPRARAAATYMAQLPGLCPDPANLPAYAAMVTEGSQARAVPAPVTPAPPVPAQPPQRGAAENPRLASAGQWLDGTRAGRHQASVPRDVPAYTAPPAQAGRPPEGLSRQTERLARVLGADVRRLAAGPAPQPGPALASVPPPGNQTVPVDAGTLQEQVLADLMLRPASGRDIAAWLPARVFSAGNNRTLYHLISLRLENGRPVDPLIIAWDASMLAAPPDSAGTPGAAQGESLAAAALRLGAVTPAPGTAAVLAQPLYAQQVVTEAFGPDWRKAPPRTPALVHAPPVPERPQTPSPAAAPADKTARPAEPAAAAARQPVPAAPPLTSSGLPMRRPASPDGVPPGPAQRM
jgi:hypothetical protein